MRSSLRVPTCAIGETYEARKACREALRLEQIEAIETGAGDRLAALEELR